jgi:hypothetical protein
LNGRVLSFLDSAIARIQKMSPAEQALNK